MQNECLEHFFRMTGKYYSEISSGEIFTIISQDVRQVQTLISGSLFQFITDCMIAVVMFFFFIISSKGSVVIHYHNYTNRFCTTKHYEKQGRKRLSVSEKRKGV